MFYLAITIWIIIAMLAGMIEGKLFHDNPLLAMQFEERRSVDIHYPFTAARGIVALIIIITIWVKLDWIEAFSIALLMIFCFPFFHDGAYYQFRKFLSKGKVYPKGWLDRSKDTTAIFSFGFYLRCLLLVVGIMLFLPF